MILALIQMSRLGNAIIAIVTLLAAYFLSGIEFSLPHFLADSLAFTLAISFGNIHNDLLDIETDKLNRPKRPLPSGKISEKQVKISLILLLVFTLLPSLWVKSQTLHHILFFSILLIILFLYNKFTKRIPLVKNLTVAFLCITPILRVMLFDSVNITPLLPPLAFAFLYTLSREIQKDLEDVSGDKAANINTLPVVAGDSLPSKLASFQIIFAWFLLPLPVLLNWYSPSFLLAFLPITPLSLWILLSIKKKDYSNARKVTKITMICGLLSLILSQVFS